MGKINVADLKPGMVLEADLVCPTNGRFLLPAGVAVDETNLRTIKAWGCTEVAVQGLSALDVQLDNASELTPELMEQAMELAQPIFAYVDMEHPAVAELYRIFVLRQAENLRRGEKPPKRLEPVELEPVVPVPHDLFLKGQGDASQLVGEQIQLTSFPDIYFQIIEVLESPTSSANHVAEVVSKDTSLTARLLKLVNSPIYGFPSKVESVARAIALIGAQELSSLALGVSAVHVFRDIPPELADMVGFWRHSISCGLFARLIAAQKHGLSTERFFVGGLLHDIGKLVKYKYLPQASTQTLRFALANGLPMSEAEFDILGYNHSEIGRRLLENWRFPPALVEMVAWHHDPVRADVPLEAAVIHVADNLAIAMGHTSGGPPLLPGISETAWEVLDLPVSVFVPAVMQFERQISDILRAFQAD